MFRIAAPNPAPTAQIETNTSALDRKSKRVDRLLNVALFATVCFGAAVCSLPIFSHELYAPQSKHDFGVVKAGTPVRHTFTLRNLHPRTVTVARLISDCGCTKSIVGRQLPFDLKPLEQISVSTTVNTKFKQGHISQTIVVMTTDSISGTPISIRGEVRRNFERT